MTANDYTYQAHGIYTLNAGGIKPSNSTELPMIGAESASLNSTITLVANTATVSWTIQKKCRVMGVRVVDQDTTAATYTIKNGSNTISTITRGTPTAGVVTNASSVAVAYSTLNPNDTLNIVIDRTGSTAPVSVLIDLAPIGNN